MYAALRGGQLVLARQEAKQAKPGQLPAYRCPHCQQRVNLVLAQGRAPYFQHWHFCGGGGEHSEHLLGKQELKAALTAAGWSARLEIPLAGGQIRADVLAAANLAFEIQCAPLSQEEFRHRHRCYQQAGVTDVWLVGRRHFLGPKIKKTQMIYLRRNKWWDDYYLEIDVLRHQLRLLYHLRQAAWSRTLYREAAHFALDEQGLAALWTFRPVLHPYHLSALKEQRFLQQQLTSKTKLGQAVAAYLYDRHKQLADLPASSLAHWQSPGAGYEWQLLK